MDQEEIRTPPLQAEDMNVLKTSDRDNQASSSGDEEAKVLLSSLTVHAETESATEASNGQDVTLSQVHAKTLELHKVCRSLFAAHQQRVEKSEKTERSVQAVKETQETLLNQIAELETRNKQFAEAIEMRTLQSISLLTARIEAAENARLEAEARTVSMGVQQDAYKQAWQSAPLTLRLKFVHELLPDDHALQNILKESAALEELRRRGRDLESWLANYPALFADAAQALMSGTHADVNELNSFKTYPADTLAVQTLCDAQATLETTLQALGITWVAPSPGDAILTEHEVIGEEDSLQNEGCIVRLRRRGFRVQGRLALPAQVIRAAKSHMLETALPERVNTTNTLKNEDLADDLKGFIRNIGLTHPASSSSAQNNAISASETQIDEADMEQDGYSKVVTKGGEPDRQVISLEPEHVDGLNGLPDWLRMLGQRTFGCDIPAVSLLAEQVFALNDLPARLVVETEEDAKCQLLVDVLQPMLPLLGLRYADALPSIPVQWGRVFLDVREPLLAWLSEKIGLLLIAPSRGAGFNPKVMVAIETRRTVHANEDETVAKLERIGLLWRNHPLIPAQVVRYTTGEMA